jgi:hypothetical protein
MKKQIVPLLALVVALAAGSAYAQLGAPNGVKANIPFNFTINKTSFPAGQYTVKSSGTMGTLVIRGENSTQMVSTHGVTAGKPSGTSKLIFHRYGDQYFLSQIWVEGSDSGRELPRTRVEKELMSKAESTPTTVLAQK